MMSTEPTLYVEGATGPWEVVIGLEVHAQVISQSKLFSGASATFGADPNSQVSFVDAGFPGMLPVLNRVCVEQAIRTGLGINATVNPYSAFDRKNYFYADLPAGYQISQFKYPIVSHGFLEIDGAEGMVKRIRILRMHLEQDAGKSIHDQHPTKSYIDLNRAGVALMEIVSEPDMRSAEEAAAYLKKLRTILRYLGTCDGNMEEGSMRADVNVSVRRPGEPLGTRAEIKNVNSIRFLSQAVQFETARQIGLLESGQSVRQETRLFDAALGETRAMRGKENAHDYRYFPDPDLPPVIIDPQLIEEIRASMPELPDEKQRRFIRQFGLPVYDASVLVAEKEIADFYEAVLLPFGGRDCPALVAKMAVNWLMGDFFGALNRSGLSITQSPVSPGALAGLLGLLQKEVISGKIAKDVFLEMWETGAEADAIVTARGWQQVTDTGAIESIIEAVLQENQDKVAQYKSGKDKLFGFFVGQVMKAMGGKGNPTMINEILLKRLNG
jgi:aspartyl-tRNA(Asn)/glutamyl-tRNA(Gln) amidotransferase subunit B